MFVLCSQFYAPKVTGFVSGGMVPTSIRGSTSHALMHATDWFPTILSFVDSQVGNGTTKFSAPELDGVDMWPTLTNTSNMNTSTIDPAITFVHLPVTVMNIRVAKSCLLAHTDRFSPRFEIPHNVDPLLNATGMPNEPQVVNYKL